MDHYDFVSDYGSDTTSFESDEEGFEDEEERERLLWHCNSSKCTLTEPPHPLSPKKQSVSSHNQNQPTSLNLANCSTSFNANFTGGGVVDKLSTLPPNNVKPHRHIIQLRRFGRGCSTWV